MRLRPKLSLSPAPVERAVAALAQDGVYLAQQFRIVAQLGEELADAYLLAPASVHWKALETRMRKLRPAGGDPQRGQQFKT